ncbi:MAG: inositol-3-phosphate synthase [bacterium]
MKKIKVAIVGVGNCASSLIQGIEYYRGKNEEDIIGLMHHNLGGYKPEDIKFVSAFDIDKRKVNLDLSEAIFQLPNCTKKICNVPFMNVKVELGFLLDGVARHMLNYPESQTFVIDEYLDDFVPDDKRNEAMERIVKILKEKGAEILINYLPVGSQHATEFYMECALKASCAVINCMPVFIASNKDWEKKFKEKNIPIIGDDIKSQVGATIVHRVLTKLFEDRGVVLDRTYQLNTGGNTDFLNMLNRDRLASKKISKTQSVQSQLKTPLAPENIHIGPSDYVPWQKDNKVCFIRMEGRGFGDVPLNLELRLSVEDSPNSAGVAIDAIRCLKLALDRKMGGALIEPSSYFMKSPLKQFSDTEAKRLTEEFIANKT